MKTYLLALTLALAPTLSSAADVLTVPNCRYGEQRTDGQLACVQPTQIYTDSGAIPLPTYVVNGATLSDTPLGLRVTPSGAFKLAGQSHAGLGTWVYEGGAWRIVGPSYGVNAVLWDGGSLLVGAPSYGSQGLRFIGPGPLPACTGNPQKTLCTGDNTYADPARILGEWTQLGDVAAGQSGYSCIAIYQGVRRVLDVGPAPGGCVELHMTREGETLAISYHIQAENARRFRLLQASELSTFPVQGGPTDPVDPPVEPPIPPQPVECGTVPSNGQTAIRALYARPDIYALVTSANDEDRRAATKIFAEQTAYTVAPAWGTKRADPNRPPSKDAISRYVGTALCNWDIINGTTRELQFGHGEDITGQVFIPVTPTNHLGTGPNPDPDPQPDPEIAVLKARILVLEGQVLTLTEQNAALTIERDALQRKLDAIVAAPPPTCTVTVSGPGWVRSLFGISATCEVVR